MEPSSPQLMALRGLQERLVHQTISMTSPMETVLSLQLVIQDKSSPLQMELLGIIGLLEQQILLQELITETVPSWQ